LALKGGDLEYIVFAALVGVPFADNTCQGTGTEIEANNCLGHTEMQYQEEWVPSEVPGLDTYRFYPACTRVSEGQIVTRATPGRRFVELAQRFGENGFVSSICNDDWSEAMRSIAKLVSGCPVVVK
jgi:hypothetical protein